MFCPKCGSILMPKVVDGKKVIQCSCGYKSGETEKLKLTENIGNGKKQKFAVAEPEKEEETMPKTKAECPKCGNREAYFWEVQTRAGDEPPTKFLKCVKCKHTWRDYS